MCYLSLLVRTHSNERLAKPFLSQEFAYLSGGTKWHCGCVEATLRTSSQRLSKLTAIAGVGAANSTRTHSLEPYNMVVV